MYIAINHHTLLSLSRAFCGGWKMTTDEARRQYQCGLELSALFCPMSLPPLHSLAHTHSYSQRICQLFRNGRKEVYKVKLQLFAILPRCPSTTFAGPFN